MHRLLLPSALALLWILILLLAGSPPPALAASDSISVSLVSTRLYTTYLPLLMTASDPSLIPEVVPNDPYFDRAWGMTIIGAPKAWALTRGDPSILVAVLDSGVDLDHPDLAAKTRVDIDRDFVNNDNVADDDHGHGTHVAGIAAAATNNATGVPGLGWDVAILPLKVLNSWGVGYANALADAIRYAADHGANVINMSLGGAAPCPYYLQEAVDYAYMRGVLLVAAAGNNQGNTENFPANCEHVLGVAATDPDDTRAGYSNYSNAVSVAAPGTLIYSTMMNGGYGYMSGTSMATPHVAGLAALVVVRYPTYTPDQVASALLDNALDLGPAGWDMETGCGRIDAHRSLLYGARGDSPRCLEGRSGVWLHAVGAERPQDASPTAPFAPGEIIISLRPGARMGSLALEYGHTVEPLPALRAWRMQVPAGQEYLYLARLRADPAVAHADLNYLVTGQ